jgi:hypothetical protein
VDEGFVHNLFYSVVNFINADWSIQCVSTMESKTLLSEEPEDVMGGVASSMFDDLIWVVKKIIGGPS